ncbi:uncharacterized protein LOC141537252 isoform X3 [Cotesia typhae]
MLNGTPILTRTHNHANNPLLEKFSTFQKSLYDATMIRPYRSIRALYDHISVQQHEAAVEFTWAKMQPLMERWRRRDRPRHPPIPNNLEQYANYLNMPEWAQLLKYSQGQLTASTQTMSNGKLLTILYNSDFLRTVVNVKTLFMDATFKITPKKPKTYQVFTILGLINDHKALPLCWMLMEKKSALSYKTGLSYFKNVVAPHIDPEMIMTDFEAGLKQPINELYPRATHSGCFFHFCQSIVKKLKQLQLHELILNWTYGQIIIRKIMALALLPPDAARQGFTWLCENTPLPILNILQEFILYFDDQWMQRAPPELWSVYRNNHRTDNFTESYHKNAKGRFGVHPSIWQFTEKLTELQAVTHIEYASLQNGMNVTRAARRHTTDTNFKIIKAWDLYDAESLDIPNFLACASHFLHAFHRNSQNYPELNNHLINGTGNIVDGIPNIYDQFLVFAELNVLDIN